jgi:hypothetical protein
MEKVPPSFPRPTRPSLGSGCYRRFLDLAFFAFIGYLSIASAFADAFSETQAVPVTPSVAQSEAMQATINRSVEALTHQRFDPSAPAGASVAALPPPIPVADLSDGQMPPPVPVSSAAPIPDPMPAAEALSPETQIISISHATPGAGSPAPASPAPMTIADAATTVKYEETLAPPKPQPIEEAAEHFKEFQPQSEDSPNAPDAVKPETMHAWEKQLEILEQENQALRQKLRLSVDDPLRDIEVDAVSTIHEDVLRARITELEQQIDKLNMKNDISLPQKTKSDHPAGRTMPLP